MDQIFVRNGGFGKLGDSVLMEPALAAFGESRQCKIFFNVEFNLGHDQLFEDHPYIVPIPSIPPNVIPQFQTDSSRAFHEAHAREIPFGAGYFSQFDLDYRKYRNHYKSYYIDKISRDDLKSHKYYDYIGLVPNGYSCVSRDSTTGEINTGRRPNVQPSRDWWKVILDILDGPKVSLSSSKGSWDCIQFPGIEVAKTESMIDLLTTLKACRLLISVETGTLHLTSATKTPTVFLCSATPPFFSKPDTRVSVIRAEYADMFSKGDCVNSCFVLLERGYE